MKIDIDLIFDLHCFNGYSMEEDVGEKLRRVKRSVVEMAFAS